jgi:hypothetical protein
MSSIGRYRCYWKIFSWRNNKLCLQAKG